MKFMKLRFFIIPFVFMCLNLNSEIKYKVSGQVLRNGKGVKKIAVIVDASSSSKGINLRFKDCLSTTDEDGNFYFYLPPGEYDIRCDMLFHGMEEYYIPVGPRKVIVNDKNINNLKFTLYKEIEIVEANIDILKEIPTSTPKVTYKWGKVPIHSEKECKTFAVEWMSEIKSIISSDITFGAKIGSPVVFFDLSDNPVFYQYPVENLGVQIAYFGVHAIGMEPIEDFNAGYLEVNTLSDLKKLKEESKLEKMTWDLYIPDAIEVVAKKKNYNKKDIVSVKLICLDSIHMASLCVMLRIVPTNEIVLVNLRNNQILTDGASLEEIKEDSELQSTLNYIIQVKQKRKKPLI